MQGPIYETVHTITDWYDGARAGIANFQGKPHFYRCKQDHGPTDDYLLTPLDDEAFALAMEDWAIWLRWQAAFDEGYTTIDTHPALPGETERHIEIEELLTRKPTDASFSAIEVKANFLYGENTVVQWTI